MSSNREPHTDDPAPEQEGSLPVLRSWWSELSPAAKILIPTSAAMLVFVTVSAVPPFVV